ncbi:Vanadium-dependent bromoperoxidase [Nymphon striatum]|nr:Vanadium-dependent bromoperoxidase [Nymphon striatum]
MISGGGVTARNMRSIAMVLNAQADERGTTWVFPWRYSCIDLRQRRRRGLALRAHRTPSTKGPGSGQGFLDDFVPRSPAEARRIRAYRIREHAASLAAEEPLPNHVVNGDERPDLDYALSFTKGLPHDHNTGLLSDPADYEQFVYATKTGKAQDFLATPLGPRTGFRTVDGEYELRAWESQGIGHAFDLVGPDPQSVTMPPPPAVGSPELTAEMAEVYAQAILRDEPLSALRLGYAGQHAPRRNDRFTQ